MGLLMEAFGFSLHCLNRATFRGADEKLREAIFDPAVHRVAQLFQEMMAQHLEKTELTSDKSDVLRFIAERELLYAKMPSVLGNDLNDPQSVLSVATNIIAEAVGRPKYLVLLELIRYELLQFFNEMNLRNRVKEIEANT
jgi:hypothetical protein